MDIFFDYQAFEMQSFGGVSRCYAELITNLQKEDCSCTLGVKESDNVHLKESGLAVNLKPLHYQHDKWFGGRKRFKGQRALTRALLKVVGQTKDFLDVNQRHCIELLKQNRFDIFEPTFFMPYFLPYLNGKPFVLTVHDMIPEIMGVDQIQAEQKKLLCPLATHIHVPSQNTKNDLVRILGIAPEKVTVTPHGAPPRPSDRYPSPYTFPYLLFVGGRWSYKNFAPFVEECAIIIERHPEVHVVCTGYPFTQEEMRLIANQGLAHHFESAYVDEQQLQALYQNALAFVYPSAYEGFGLPILEAFVNGCPVALNHCSCFPEVGGDAAVYFDMNQRGSMADCLDPLLVGGAGKRMEMVGKGYEQAHKFSWEKTAKTMKEVYESLI